MLQDDFVLGWENIQDEPFVGDSFGYQSCQSAVGTTNGAGAHNVQIFVLAPDLTVLHALPGFWHPDDLARELRFALQVESLRTDTGRSAEDRAEAFRSLHAAEIARQPDVTTARSKMQTFDLAEEQRRRTQEERDTFRVTEDGRIEAKPINVLLHERMAERAFVAFEDFDTAAFVDYGRKFYDNNMAKDGRGVPFVTVHSRGR